MPKKILLFDIDGTLLLTGGAGKIAFEKVIHEMFDIPDAWGNIIPDGKTDPVIIEEIITAILDRPLTAGEYGTLCDRYHFYFETEVARIQTFRLMPGFPALLELLYERKDLCLGIATGNFEKAAYLKLKRGGLHGFFRFGGYGSDSRVRHELTRIAYERGLAAAGEHVPPERVFVIGDTLHDIEAGKKIKARTIAVATGGTPAEKLTQAGPDYFFPDLRESEKFLEILQD